LETKDKFYPLLQELTYIRPLTFASAAAFAKGVDSDPDLHNSCTPGGFGSKFADLERDVECVGLSGPYGTGPFKLVVDERKTNAENIDTTLIFQRHEMYWKKVPDLEFLHLKYYSTTEDIERDLISGDLDMALGIGPLKPAQIQNLKNEHSNIVDVRHSDVLQHSLMIMNTNKGATQDINTRRAIIHAIDKYRFIEEEFAGLERPVSQLLPDSAPFCDVDLSPKWAYDLEKATLLNCPADDDLGGGAIAGIVVGALAFVALLGLVTRMYVREKQGKPMFKPVDKESTEWA
jgi:nickel transport system substrate-binding protein